MRQGDTKEKHWAPQGVVHLSGLNRSMTAPIIDGGSFSQKTTEVFRST